MNECGDAVGSVGAAQSRLMKRLPAQAAREGGAAAAPQEVAAQPPAQ